MNESQVFGVQVPKDTQQETLLEDKNYVLNGVVFTSTQLRRVILISEKITDFNLSFFLRIFLCHVGFVFTGPFIGIPLSFVVMKFSYYGVYNQGFIGVKRNFFVQSALGILVGLGIFFLYLTYLESLEPESEVVFSWMDWVQVLIQCLIRIFVISTKYGFFSIENRHITLNLNKSDFLNRFDLIMVASMDRRNEILYERLGLIIDYLRIN